MKKTVSITRDWENIEVPVPVQFHMLMFLKKLMLRNLHMDFLQLQVLHSTI
jgi:hypothetical protein